VREELFWGRTTDRVSPEVVIERAINFGGLDFIEAVQKKYGMKTFIHVLKHHRNLSKKAANYWCLRLGIDRNSTKTFQARRIWEPLGKSKQGIEADRARTVVWGRGTKSFRNRVQRPGATADDPIGDDIAKNKKSVPYFK